MKSDVNKTWGIVFDVDPEDGLVLKTAGIMYYQTLMLLPKHRALEKYKAWFNILSHLGQRYCGRMAMGYAAIQMLHDPQVAPVQHAPVAISTMPHAGF